MKPSLSRPSRGHHESRLRSEPGRIGDGKNIRAPLGRVLAFTAFAPVKKAGRLLGREDEHRRTVGRLTHGWMGQTSRSSIPLRVRRRRNPESFEPTYGRVNLPTPLLTSTAHGRNSRTTRPTLLAAQPAGRDDRRQCPSNASALRALAIASQSFSTPLPPATLVPPVSSTKPA